MNLFNLFGSKPAPTNTPQKPADAPLGELAWIAEARKHIGEREIKGTKHNPFIVGIWSAVGASWFKDDETPWCAGYVAYCLKKAGRPILGPATVARALAWADYGTKLIKPAYGCLAVKSRNGGGHVGFVVGKDAKGNLMILGGNQNDQVKISAYKATDFQHFRWPDKAKGVGSVPDAGRFDLPVLNSDGTTGGRED